MRVLSVPDDEAPGSGATTLERIRHLLEAQLRELLRNDPGLRLGDEPEDLHRFRVATRRTRAIVRATRQLLDDTLAPLAAELKWLAGVLGPVRDYDVLLASLRRQVRALGPDEGAGEAIVAMLEDERAGLYDELLAALEDERYFALLDTFEAQVALCPMLDAPRSATDRREAAAQARQRAARRLPAEPRDEELHELRIRAKRARYSAELAAVGGTSSKLSRYIDAAEDAPGRGRRASGRGRREEAHGDARTEDRQPRRRATDRARVRAPRERRRAYPTPGVDAVRRERPQGTALRLSPLVHTHALRGPAGD